MKQDGNLTLGELESAARKRANWDDQWEGPLNDTFEAWYDGDCEDLYEAMLALANAHGVGIGRSLGKLMREIESWAGSKK